MDIFPSTNSANSQQRTSMADTADESTNKRLRHLFTKEKRYSEKLEDELNEMGNYLSRLRNDRDQQLVDHGDAFYDKLKKERQLHDDQILAAQGKEEADQETIRLLQAEILHLKQLSGFLGGNGMQVSDNVLKDRFVTLFNDMQNRTMGFCGKAHLVKSLSGLSPTTLNMLTNAVPLQESDWTGISSASFILQALVTCQLVKIFAGGAFGIPWDCALRTKRTGMAYFDLAENPEQFEKWRAATWRAFNLSNAKVLEETKVAIDRMARSLDTAFMELCAIGPDERRYETLIAILDKTVKLSRTFQQQHARYHFYYAPCSPGLNNGFLPAYMSDVWGTDQSGWQGRKLQFSVFPGLIKRGDEYGSNISTVTNVICKARVQCFEE